MTFIIFLLLPQCKHSFQQEILMTPFWNQRLQESKSLSHRRIPNPIHMESLTLNFLIKLSLGGIKSLSSFILQLTLCSGFYVG